MDPALVNRDPDIMSGVLCFSGTRVPVKALFDYLEGSSSLEDFLVDFPTVSRDRAVAVLEAARQSLIADASVSVFVLDAPSAELRYLLPLIPKLEAALIDHNPGLFVVLRA